VTHYKNRGGGKRGEKGGKRGNGGTGPNKGEGYRRKTRAPHPKGKDVAVIGVEGREGRERD